MGAGGAWTGRAMLLVELGMLEIDIRCTSWANDADHACPTDEGRQVPANGLETAIVRPLDRQPHAKGITDCYFRL